MKRLSTKRLATVLSVVALLAAGCSMAGVNERMEYWRAKAEIDLMPGTSVDTARALFKAQGLDLHCCTTGPDFRDAYVAVEHNVGRSFLIEYDVAVIVEVAQGDKIQRVRVQRWGVGL